MKLQFKFVFVFVIGNKTSDNFVYVSYKRNKVIIHIGVRSSTIAVLILLVEIAHNDKIRDCIRLYDTEKPTKDNKKSLKSCRKDSIIETLNFLSKALNEGINKDDAIDKLCMKIQNFFPDFCQVCEQSYIVKMKINTS